MERLYVLLIATLACCNVGYTSAPAQANLVLTSLDLSKTVLAEGEPYSFRAVVQNSGNLPAGPSFAFVYNTPVADPLPTDIRLRLSVPALAAGDTAELRGTILMAQNVPDGQYFLLDLDVFNEVAESDENNSYCSPGANGNCGQISITNDTYYGGPKLGAPLLFIHGLNSSAETWEDMLIELIREFSLDYGGTLHYCLNPDGNQSTSDGYVSQFPDFEPLRPADMYAINFDVSVGGQPYVKDITLLNAYSNQSAVAKQGLALAMAIDEVLALTGADEVILVGHSMGGLAARDYLQTPELWVGEGANGHKVRHLMTWGTPHGGSNLTFGPFDIIFSGVDDESEAVRDLRYNALFFKGYYLDSGTEVNDNDYHNMDIDLNGRLGDFIQGKNQTPFPNDVNLSCAIGNPGNNNIDDWVVNITSADMRRHLYAQAPLQLPFIGLQEINKRHDKMLMNEIPTLFAGIDEPNEFGVPQKLNLPTIKYGYITQPQDNQPNETFDLDVYRIELADAGELAFGIENMPVANAAIALFDETGQLLSSRLSDGGSTMQLDTFIAAGTYLLTVDGIPTANSYRFPYTLMVSHAPLALPIARFTRNTTTGCSPISVDYQFTGSGEVDAYEWNFPGGQPATSNVANPTVTYTSAGTFAALLQVSNRAGSDNSNLTSAVVVQDIAMVDASYAIDNAYDVQFTSSLTGGSSTDIQWEFGDGNTSALSSPTHRYGEAGTYAVNVAATNACGTSNAALTVVLETSNTSDQISQIEAVLSPNPFEGQLSLKLGTALAADAVVGLYSVTGALVFEVALVSGQQEVVIQTSELAAGMYMVRLAGGEGVASWRVMRG